MGRQSFRRAAYTAEAMSNKISVASSATSKRKITAQVPIAP